MFDSFRSGSKCSKQTRSPAPGIFSKVPIRSKFQPRFVRSFGNKARNIPYPHFIHSERGVMSDNQNSRHLYQAVGIIIIVGLICGAIWVAIVKDDSLEHARIPCHLDKGIDFDETPQTNSPNGLARDNQGRFLVLHGTQIAVLQSEHNRKPFVALPSSSAGTPVPTFIVYSLKGHCGHVSVNYVDADITLLQTEYRGSVVYYRNGHYQPHNL